MRKFLIGLVIFVVAVILIFWLFFRNRSPEGDVGVIPSPAPVLDLSQNDIPLEPQDSTKNSENTSYVADLWENNLVRTGQVRWLELSKNQTLVTVVLTTPMSLQTPTVLRIYAGTCEALGGRIADLTTIREYAAEEILSQSLSELFPADEGRVAVISQANGSDDHQLCGAPRRGGAPQAMTFPTLRRIAPAQTHQPANTGWSLW